MQHIFAGGARNGEILPDDGVPAGLEGYRLQGIASTKSACYAIWVPIGSSEIEGAALATSTLGGPLGWFKAVTTAHMTAHEDMAKGLTWNFNLRPYGVTTVHHSAHGGPVASIASSAVVAAILTANTIDQAAVAIVDLAAASSSVPMSDKARAVAVSQAPAMVLPLWENLTAARK